MRRELAPLVLILLSGLVVEARGQSVPGRRNISLAEARPALEAMRSSLPKELKSAGTLTESQWSNWVQQKDREIRQRLDRGEEDTLTNLLRFGVSFTKEYRIDDEYLMKYGESTLVNAFAENRASDLIRAMSSAHADERIAHMRAFLEQKGFSLKTPAERRKVRTYLLDNLARMRDEFLRYRAQAKDESRFQLFKERGISLDTNLWPDFLIDQHLHHMVEKGLLKPGSMQRIAVIGPGLDFANKENGSDFYPPQMVQPFAVLDSLVRLGIVDATSVQLYTLDISPDVNFHVQRARKNAAAGRSYTVQLPWDSAARQTPEYRASFVEYWKQLGGAIGAPVTAIPVPNSLAAGTRTRAVRIPPRIVRRIIPVDMNIVFQRLQVAPQEAFDLVIGTNIFVYYGAFEQSLARANAAAMLRPGGYLLTNDKLADAAPSGLQDSLLTTLIVARDPDMTEFMFCYERAN